MTKIRRFLLLFYLMNKRILRKYSFLILLGTVPLLSAGLLLAAKEESGILHILLCQEEKEDELSRQVMEELLGQKSILRYTVAESPEEACAAVEKHEADAAWIFPGNMQERVDADASGRKRREPLVRVVEREDTVFLQLARERLYGALYPHLSYSLYRDCCLEFLDGETLTDEKLRQEYETLAVSGSLFAYAYESRQEGSGQEPNYLLTPLRGLLAVFVLLCGLTASLYYQQDREMKLFEWIPVGNSVVFSWLYHGTAVLDALLAALAALFLSGLWTDTGRELVLMLFYGLLCVGFCDLVRKLCRTMQGLAVCIPVLLCTILVVCPIFISLRTLRFLQFLFPPFYYLQAIHRSEVLLPMVLYLIFLYTAAFLIKEKPLA